MSADRVYRLYLVTGSVSAKWTGTHCHVTPIVVNSKTFDGSRARVDISFRGKSLRSSIVRTSRCRVVPPIQSIRVVVVVVGDWRIGAFGNRTRLDNN